MNLEKNKFCEYVETIGNLMGCFDLRIRTEIRGSKIVYIYSLSAFNSLKKRNWTVPFPTVGSNIDGGFNFCSCIIMMTVHISSKFCYMLISNF